MDAVIYKLLVLHWLADFVAQTDWQAQNKSKNWWALGAHVGVYTFLLAFLPLSLMDGGLPASVAVAWIAVNGACHFVTDAITSRINTRLWQAKQVHYGGTHVPRPRPALAGR